MEDGIVNQEPLSLVDIVIVLSNPMNEMNKNPEKKHPPLSIFTKKKGTTAVG
jgi:hypothetical protein